MRFPASRSPLQGRPAQAASASLAAPAHLFQGRAPPRPDEPRRRDVKAGARLSLVAKVRGLALGLKARASGPRTGAAQVVFRFRPKRKGVVFFQATKRNYLVGTARVRVAASYEDVGATAEARARPGRRRRSTPRSDGCSRSTATSGHDSRPSAAAPSSAPKQRSVPAVEDLTAERLPAGGRLELAQLLERVDPDIRVRADADADSPLAQALERRESRRRGSPRSSGRCRRAHPPRPGGRARGRRRGSHGRRWFVGPGSPYAREARSAGRRAPRCTRRSRAAARRRGRAAAGAPARHRRRSPRASRAGRRGRSGGHSRLARRRRAAPRAGRKYSAVESCRNRSMPPRA